MAGEATIGSAFIQLIPSTEGIGKAIGGALGGSEVANAATKAGESAGSSLGSGITKAAGIAAVGVGAVAVAAAGVGAGLLKLGSTFDDAFDSIQVKTGATGATLDGLKDTFKQTFASVPSSAEDVSTAIGTLNQKLGLTGQPLGDLSKQVLDLSRITGTDLTTNIKGITDTFNNWGVASENQGNFLDDLFRVSQKTGVGVDTLSAQMADSGVVLRQSGLDFDQAAVFLGTLSKNGIDAADVMPALSKSLASAAKDGKSAKDVLGETFTAIKNAPSDTAAASVAMDVFGARAGPKLAASIREGKVSLTDLNTDIAGVGSSIEETADNTADFPEKFGTAMNKAKVALEPLASKVFGFVGDMADKFGNILPGLLSTFGNIFNGIGDKVGPILETAGNAVGGLISAFSGEGVTSSGIVGVFEKIGVVARDVFDTIKSIDWGAVFSTAVGFITPVVSAIQDLAGAVINFAVSGFQTLKQLIIDNQGTLETIETVLIRVGSFIRDVLNGAIKILSDTFNFLATHMGLVKAVLVPLLVLFGTYQVIMGAVAIATGIYSAAQAVATTAVGLFNAVLALNPIVLVIASLAALAAGIYYAYTHFDTFRAIVDGFWQVIQTVFHWIEDHWQLLLAILTGPIGVAVLLIKDNWDKIQAGVQAMVDFVRGLIDGFVKIFIDLPINILNAIGDFASLLLQKGIDLIVGLVNGYVGAYSFIIGEVVQLGSKVLGWIGDLAGLLIGKGKDLILGLVNGYISAYSWIINEVVQLGGKILSWIGDFGSLLVSKGINLIQGLYNGIVGAYSLIIGAVGGIASTAINAVGDLGSTLYNAGRSLISGFINGIKDAIGGIKDTLGGIASAAISWKGPPSYDEVVLRENGRLMIQGFINGLESMYPQIKSTLGSITADIASTPLAFPSPGLRVSPAGVGASGGYGAGTGPSTVVHLSQTNNTNATPDQIAQATTFKLATAGVPV